jgi:hypothetical protein
MVFLQNLPPREVYDRSGIQVMAEIRNKGAHTIDKADFYLSGYDNERIIQSLTRSIQKNGLQGKSEFLLDGGYDTLDFGNSEINMPEKGSDEYRPTFVVSACYNYKTFATPVVCIDPNRQNPTIRDKGACQVGPVSVGGTGAPMSVERVEVDSSIDRAFFRIHITNSGSGQVVKEDSLSKCPFDLGFQDVDEVTYSIRLSDKPPTTCSPNIDGAGRGEQGKVKLSDGRATISCEFQIGKENRFAYTTPLEVELSYGYTESIYEEVRIINTGAAGR